MNAPMYSDADRKSRDRRSFVHAVRFSLGVVALAVVALITAIVWMGQCSVSLDVDQALCGKRGTPLISMAAPGILLIGGIVAFAQTYRVWRRRESWWIWQGAGWFLLLLMVVMLVLAGRMITT
ncbi:hypothetical protein BST43_13565 [Mycobacteroides saopaulense]|uniref:Transmembrane protein n=1 Tax=Mycobacteroides saopaulense TaxID=1578165 RepID=A0A1S4W124_9MYCO|nr:hypothetical protein [Mycobacteroides saopaulense]ALR11789.1 hypothetical protein MYCSP_10375 [Mycobacteroides saopaulense]ORB56491.1 hypothetical protein BST43_13565 [Mycobacteroides saopaulense]